MGSLPKLVWILLILIAKCGAPFVAESRGASNSVGQSLTSNSEPSRAVLLLIDKSGSMRDLNRFRHAQNIAKSIALGLGETDLLAVISYNDKPNVVVPFNSVAKIRGEVESSIDGLQAEGLTNMLSALSEAKSRFDQVEAQRKHVVILSDGSTAGSLGNLVALAGAMNTESKLSISSIAIRANLASPEFEKLLQVSQNGKGLFYCACDSTAVSRVVLEFLSNSGRGLRVSDQFSQCEGEIIPGWQYPY